MKDENQIPGEIFSPCFTTEEEYEAAYKNSIFYVEGDYMAEYRKHMVGMGHVANMAKSYILNNWQRITDWSGLEVTLNHGPTGESTTYYTYVPSKKTSIGNIGSKTFKELMKSIDEADQQRHNPIREFNAVVLDPTDGDFSVTVNGNEEHWWISDESIIIIADYIEKHLKKGSQ